MRIRSLSVASLSALTTVVALLACSSSSSDAPRSGQDAADPDTGTADTSPAVDAADAAPDPKKACDALTAAVKPMQNKITLGAANKHPLSQAPSGVGGSVVEGTYRLTAYDAYDDGATTMAGTLYATLQLKDGFWEMVSSNGTSPDNTGGGTYAVKDKKIFWTPGCGTLTGGPTNGGNTENAGSYTSTPTTITFVIPNGMGTVVTKTVYIKDP